MFSRLFKTLYAKLALVLFLLFCIVGGTFLVAALYSAQMYQQEVAQRLNRDLAMYIVDEHVLLKDNEVNQAELEDLFHTLMIINPSLELYLLEADGHILSYSGSSENIQRDQVDLDPVKEIMGDTATLPVLGDDPRHADRKKAFSAAPIISDGELQGYIYAILGSEQVDNITELLENSFIMRWSILAAGAALIFSLAAGLLVFALLTRRLRALSHSMETFRLQNFKTPVTCPVRMDKASDEADRLSISFYEMAIHIRAQMERLRETDTLRRELVANVSHDLRTPLASLNGYLETLILKNSSLTDQQRNEYLETASRHAEHLTKLVSDLFELAKLDAHELKPEQEPFPLAELIQDVIQKFTLRATQQGVTLEVEATSGTAFANGDIGMIERVLDNLIVNALQHTPQGGNIRISLTEKNNRIIVKVKDTGAGIPADDIPHVFDRFYRQTTGKGSNHNGAGLGLAISHRIVELHGGELSVSSVVDRGSEFGFTLPVDSSVTA